MRLSGAVFRRKLGGFVNRRVCARGVRGRGKAEEYIHQMLERRNERYVPPYNVALVFAGLGETERVQHWLGQALEARDVHMPG